MQPWDSLITILLPWVGRHDSSTVSTVSEAPSPTTRRRKGRRADFQQPANCGGFGSLRIIKKQQLLIGKSW